ncbi:MAG TPA: gliding motility-associated C-terminal domain-containing protein, partial [Saprospiraceae bacterium]|nr:gliding motility-associated C-terminal domain-containing protein [Saprospiraceae bacterium]
MLRHIFLLLLTCSFFAPIVNAQITDNLYAFYNFDDCSTRDVQGSNHGVPHVTPDCVCGLTDMAIRFDGSQYIELGDKTSGLIPTLTGDEFTLVLSLTTSRKYGPMTVFSIVEDCDSYGYELIYNPIQSKFTLNIRSQTELTSINFDDDPGACWQQVAINRLFNRMDIIVNGQLKYTQKWVTNPDFRSLGLPILGGGGCTGKTTTRFIGLIDEVKVYNRILSVDNAKIVTSKVINKLNDHFQVIFKGQSYGVEFITNCPVNVSWLPTQGVSDPASNIVELSPETTTKYSVSSFYEGCTDVDTILIKVLDESNIQCNKLLLPNSFTPNDDGLNDTYGISTTYAIDGDCLFEIFNKYGGKVFSTKDPNGRWDGKIGNDVAPPGLYLYKVRYTCADKQ